jgi:hypothetical protein
MIGSTQIDATPGTRPRRVVLNQPCFAMFAVFQALEAESLVDVVGVTVATNAEAASAATHFLKAEVLNFEREIAIGRGDVCAPGAISHYLPDTFERLSVIERLALAMMDRIDIYRAMTYGDRQAVFKQCAAKSFAALERLKPDLYFSKQIPHEVFDYIFSGACTASSIETLQFVETGLPGRWLLSKTIAQPWTRVVPRHVEEADDTLDVLRQRILGTAPISRPYYMTASERSEALHRDGHRHAALPVMPLRAIARLLMAAAYDIARNPASSRAQIDATRRQLSMHAKDLHFRGLSADYRAHARAIPVTASAPYIYFLLHLQPELTTAPLGGVFVDQLLAISALSKSLPSGWTIRVKEHPHQFFGYTWHGAMGRSANYYRDLARIPGVEIVPMEVDHFAMMEGAAFVATITGTAAWEAVIKGIPAIIFGDSWVEGCPGVSRITSSADAAALLAAPRPAIVPTATLAFLETAITTSHAVVLSDEEATGLGRPRGRDIVRRIAKILLRDYFHRDDVACDRILATL